MLSKVKEECTSVEKEESQTEDKSSPIKTEKKLKILDTEVMQNTKAKKVKNAKKGRLIVRNLPFKVCKTELVYILSVSSWFVSLVHSILLPEGALSRRTFRCYSEGITDIRLMRMCVLNAYSIMPWLTFTQVMLFIN